MKSPFTSRSRWLLILIVVVLSIPIHMAAKKIVWYETKKLLSPGVQAPAFHLRNTKGQIIDLAGFRGKVVMITFCDFTSGVCAAQGKDLNGFAEKFTHKGLEILFIADSPALSDMKRFDELVDADYFILQDRGGRIHDKYSVEGNFPTHYFIDKAGVISGSKRGRYRARGEVSKLIESLLEEEL